MRLPESLTRNLATRRSFLMGTASLVATGLMQPVSSAAQTDAKAPRDPELLVIGPRPGYTPEIGTMVSMLSYMQSALNGFIKGLTQPELDTLFDKNANSIGALILHLAATETYYQMNTFGNMKWDSWSAELKKKWDPAMNLGDLGRKEVKGHDLKYYTDILAETREKTLAEFKKKDDAWFQSGETEQFGTMKVNIHWKWFHVCEHISHHSGQIRFPAQAPSRCQARFGVASTGQEQNASASGPYQQPAARRILESGELILREPSQSDYRA